jgi:hypothetical protein
MKLDIGESVELPGDGKNSGFLLSENDTQVWYFSETVSSAMPIAG